jgi:hypothetical protein
MKVHHFNTVAGFSLIHALITGSLIAFIAVFFVFFQKLFGWHSWITVPLLIILSLVVVVGGGWVLLQIVDALSQKGMVEIERNGKKYTATWWVEKGILTVSTTPGSREAPIRDSKPEDLARRMLSEMISSGAADV